MKSLSPIGDIAFSSQLAVRLESRCMMHASTLQHDVSKSDDFDKAESLMGQKQKRWVHKPVSQRKYRWP